MADDGEIYKAHITIGTDTTPSEKAAKEVQKHWKQTASEVESSSERIEKGLKKVKAEFGKRSGLGELSETLKGAGAIAGIAIIPEILEKATERAAELADKFRNGMLSGKEFTYELGKSLPIFGSILGAIENIHELYTGEKAAQEKINEEIRYGNELYSMRTKLAKANEDSNISAEKKMGAASARLREANAQPGIARTVQTKQDATDSQENDLRLEISPMMNKRRQQDAQDALSDEMFKKLEGSKSPEQTKKITDEYAEKSAIAAKSIDKYNTDLAMRNNATIKTLDKANAAEIKEIQSGAQEIFSIRASAANKLAETRAGKLENFRSEKQHEGFSGAALDNLTAAKNEELQAQAMAGSRDALRNLNKEYANSEATTFTEKVAANRQELLEEARTGKITADSVDGLSDAFARLEHVAVDNKLKDAAIAVQQIGETDLDKQVDALARMGASSEEAAKYMADLKAAATGNDVHSIINRAALVGLNPLQAAQKEANQKGEDGGQVAAAQGKLLGAELTNSLKTPFENFNTTISYYKQLLSAGDISQKTFQLAQLKAFDGLVAGVNKTDIDSAARDRISNQFAGLGVAANLQKGMPAVANINAKQDAKKKADEDKKKHDANSKSLDKNSNSLGNLKNSVDTLNTSFQQGIAAVCT